MAEELSTGIALCTAWAGDDQISWARIVLENGVGPDDKAFNVMGQLTHTAIQLARAVASVDHRFDDAQSVLNYLAMQGFDDGESTP